MENSPWLWVNEEIGCKGKKLKKLQEEWQNNLAEMEEGIRFKNSCLIACNQQPLRGAATANSKLLSSGIELWSSKTAW